MTRLIIVLTAIGALSTGCAGPNPNSAVAGGGQDCASCQLENPGDVVVCERVCHAGPADQMGSWSGAEIH